MDFLAGRQAGRQASRQAGRYVISPIESIQLVAVNERGHE